MKTQKQPSKRRTRITIRKPHRRRAKATGMGSFFKPKSIEELVREQGVKPLKNPNVLAGGWPEDEDIDEFLSFIYEGRRRAAS